MDRQKLRLFVKNLTYDLKTVQYLMDYGRIKETVPIVEKILDNIDSFRADDLKNEFNDVFSKEFWDKKWPDSTIYSQMRTTINRYANTKSTSIEEDLDKIGYINFVKDIFVWSNENIPKLRYVAKSPLRSKVEIIGFCLVGIIITVSLLIISGQAYLSRNWGLRGDFYQGMDFKKYLFSTCKKTIDFSDPNEMNDKISHNHFSVRWKGELLVPEDATYSITLDHDDGTKLFIDGQLLIDDWHIGNFHDSKKSFLHKGPHKIVLEYFQDFGPAYLNLYWAWGKIPKQIIQAKYLRHD